VDRQPVRIVDQGFEERLDGVGVPARAGAMAPEREPCPPVLGILLDEPVAQILEPIRQAQFGVGLLESIERQVRAVG
jgi:hypothetical protein